MKRSKLQQDIIDAAKSKKVRDIVVMARAGCGKTTMLIELTKELPGRIFIGAFNRKIAKEVARKLEENKLGNGRVFSSTLHAAGVGAWTRAYPKCIVDDCKVGNIIGKMALNAGGEETPEGRLIGSSLNFIRKSVSYAKQRAFGFLIPIKSEEAWMDIFEHFGMEEELSEDYQLEDLIPYCIQALQTSISQDKERINYDDMLLAPLVHNIRMYTYGTVMIDEGQDTNPVRRALALKMLGTNGRLIVVGDDKQAINGFTGADSDSLEQIQKLRNALVLPLNLTYRCPKKVVELAQKWVPDFQAHESNEDGIVREIPYRGYTDKETYIPGLMDEQFTADDAILCRNTKPLVEAAYQLLRKGVACRVEGRDIGQGLIALASRWKVSDLNTLRGRLESYKDREIQKYQAKNNEAAAMSVEDKVETLMVLIENLQREGKNKKSDLVDFITSLFGDSDDPKSKKVLVLSTVHKAKGLEFPRVYLLGRARYMPSKWARSAWQLEQEENLMYVAVTRSMHELVDVKV